MGVFVAPLYQTLKRELLRHHLDWAAGVMRLIREIELEGVLRVHPCVLHASSRRLP